MKLVVLGLCLSSSWGNGHATTYRALLAAFAARGHDILFLEREAPWYAGHRDLWDPPYCRLRFYDRLADLESWAGEIAAADAVVIGSFVTEGAEVARRVLALAGGLTAFYDIDTPVTLSDLEAGRCSYLSADILPDFDIYLSFAGGPMLRRLEDELGARAARALFCSVDELHYLPLERAFRWDLSYLGTYSPDRQPMLERLLLEPARQAPHLRFCIAGPQYRDHRDWPDNVEHLTHVGPADHAEFYAKSRFTLNVTRAQMVAAGYSPSVRLFEAAACATPIISDPWAGIETIFHPGREILLAEEPGDTLRALAMGEGARSAIAQAGRRRVLTSHTAARRAAELEAHFAEARSRKEPVLPALNSQHNEEAAG